MNGRTLLIVVVAALAGLAAGFILANSINRKELSALRAENDRLKSEGTSSRSELTQEEISATIARADQDPTNFETQRNVGIAIYRYGVLKQDKDLIKQSVRILQRAADLQGNDYDVILSLGNANFDVGYYEKDNDSLDRARVFYTKALGAKPNDVEVITDVGLTYFLETPPKFDRAVEEFRKSLQKNPKHEKTLRFLIEALIKQEKRGEAAEYLQQLRAVNPNNEAIGELSSMLANAQPAG